MKNYGSLDLVVIIVAACDEAVYKYREEQPRDGERQIPKTSFEILELAISHAGIWTQILKDFLFVCLFVLPKPVEECF